MKPALAALGAGAAAAALYYVYKRRLASSLTAVRVLPDKCALGREAARYVAASINAAIAAKGSARVIVATGASQFEFIAELVKLPVPWDSVIFFHLDEYCDLPATHGASFRKYLQERLFTKLQPAPKAVHYLDPISPSKYEELLAEGAIDMACIGIGENGHIAFNDPPPGGADFADPRLVKKVRLDEACRKQQLGEGWFKTLSDVPTHAITLTVPAIMRAEKISCVVPDRRKAEAVRATMHAAISEAVPATILRTHNDCTLWLDEPAASLLK